jgi:acyl-CoA synthetase (AMP-forming)/AMP-acid ligase II
MTTLIDLIARSPVEDAAIAAPGRTTMSHGGLRQLIGETRAALNAHGIGRGDRLAMVLPNGPEAASAFIACASACATAPLNPAYRAEEFEFYLSDLKAKALLLAEGIETPARAVAERLGIAVIALHAETGAPAGRFHLQFADGPSAGATKGGRVESSDLALMLHTSGTTSRPKLVALSQANLAASARHIGSALALMAADRCLNIMPLFHIHGLIGAVSSSLAAGASVFATPGFNALKFFSWLEESKATWVTAVPTMYQAILARGERNRAIIQRHPLRFMRSSSSSLPPQVMKELEDLFGCPVIESYGMTEAAHQMTSNPLPPRPRRPGSVGIAAGPEVAILDDGGQILPRGGTGEVCIRGPNVSPGYVDNPAANAAAFTDGWFRTGDQGIIDAEGYLTITGRLKEIINRGGEKISPREVDEVLMDHPAVAQVVTFAMPHDKLGEDVAAAVVLREGQSLGEQALRDFAARRLADFKVPRKILFLTEIPKGATGKLQRIGLAAKLGLAP